MVTMMGGNGDKDNATTVMLSTTVVMTVLTTAHVYTHCARVYSCIYVS